MKRRLIVSPRADADREHHLGYLVTHAPQVVDRFDKAVQETIKRIDAHPRSCPTLTCPGLPDVELRFSRPSGFKNYVVVYQILDDAVQILRILHSSQEIESELHE